MAEDVKNWRFIDKGNGAVMDTLTGLMWLSDPDAVCFDVCPENVQDFYFGEAKEFCEQLDFAGHRDWRLPGRDELLSLLSGEDSGVIKKYVFLLIRQQMAWTEISGNVAFRFWCWVVRFITRPRLDVIPVRSINITEEVENE
ncbi:MAG: DUF1566 domain-containing protein [Candidatus Omnitrophota bacterium]|jgi:hypothetical protein